MVKRCKETFCYISPNLPGILVPKGCPAGDGRGAAWIITKVLGEDHATSALHFFAFCNVNQRLQSIEFRTSKSELDTALMEIQMLKERLEKLCQEICHAITHQWLEFRRRKFIETFGLIIPYSLHCRILFCEDRLDHKEVVVQQLSAKLKHHQTQSAHGHAELQEHDLMEV